MSKRSASHLFSNILDAQLPPTRRARKYALQGKPYNTDNVSLMSNDESVKLAPMFDDGINSLDVKNDQSESSQFGGGALDGEVSLPALGSTTIQLNLEHFMSNVHEVR